MLGDFIPLCFSSSALAIGMPESFTSELGFCKQLLHTFVKMFLFLTIETWILPEQVPKSSLSKCHYCNVIFPDQ